jgi:TolA-binding protein
MGAPQGRSAASDDKRLSEDFMARWFLLLVLMTLTCSGLWAQSPHSKDPAPTAQSSDARELQADIERLKVLLNQMRTNLAFVQSSQSPLKHQFELEADAWQVIVEQMDKRLKAMQERESSRSEKD